MPWVTALRPLALSTGDIDENEQKANAEIMTASPDLAGALIETLRALDDIRLWCLNGSKDGVLKGQRAKVFSYVEGRTENARGVLDLLKAKKRRI